MLLISILFNPSGYDNVKIVVDDSTKFANLATDVNRFRLVV